MGVYETEIGNKSDFGKTGGSAWEKGKGKREEGKKQPWTLGREGGEGKLGQE